MCGNVYGVLVFDFIQSVFENTHSSHVGCTKMNCVNVFQWC